MPESSICRLCAGACGVLVHSEGGQLSQIVPDSADPVSGGRPCDVLAKVPGALAHPDRIVQPLRRVGDGWQESSWADALADISTRLSEVRRSAGPSAIGLHLGGDRWSRSRETARSLAFGVALGTPHIFSDSQATSGSLLRCTEAMLGHPAVLLSDLSRAHYVVVFDGGQVDTGWGAHRRGRSYSDALAHSKGTKGTKVVVVGPRRTKLADDAHQYVAIRPGTEAFFLLGMLSAAVKGGWCDAQFIRDYTDNFSLLPELLAAWPVERCAGVCDVPAAEISGVALKFGRAAMAVAHLDERLTHSSHGSLAVWAGLALHTVTANTLRPGGLYDYAAPIDLHHPLAFLPSRGAPKTASGHPLVGLQASGELLSDHVGSAVQALVVVDGDPLGNSSAPDELASGFQNAELVVVFARAHNLTTACADWVLPLTHPFEEEELELLGSTSLPEPMVRRVRRAVTAPEGCRPAEAVLAELAGRLKPGVRGGAYGLHLALVARGLTSASLESWEGRALEWGADLDADALSSPPHRHEYGMADRSLWRVSHDNGRIDVAPDGVRPLLDAAQVFDAVAERPHWLRASVPRARVIDDEHGADRHGVVYIHPDLGVADGVLARLSTAAGALDVRVRHDLRLRADVVDLPRGVRGAGGLVPAAPRDPWTGMGCWDGLPCALQPI